MQAGKEMQGAFENRHIRRLVRPTAGVDEVVVQEDQYDSNGEEDTFFHFVSREGVFGGRITNSDEVIGNGFGDIDGMFRCRYPNVR